MSELGQDSPRMQLPMPKHFRGRSPDGGHEAPFGAAERQVSGLQEPFVQDYLYRLHWFRRDNITFGPSSAAPVKYSAVVESK
jgi:hypothetical protein